MKRKIFPLIAWLMLGCCLNGCVYLVVGGIGALGGYIVSPDTVEGLTENDEADVYDAAVTTCSVMGTVLEQQKDAGSVVAKINGAKVSINIFPTGKSSVKLSVKARKLNLPRINLAQDVFVKIMVKLTE